VHNKSLDQSPWILSGLSQLCPTNRRMMLADSAALVNSMLGGSSFGAAPFCAATLADRSDSLCGRQEEPGGDVRISDRGESNAMTSGRLRYQGTRPTTAQAVKVDLLLMPKNKWL
ncbi:MAG: hypothetical protein ABSD73_11815, partial [Candidatus Bathyarchaeia archaeon]